MKKILFYRRGALGDTLLTFPLLENLKKKNFYILAIGNTEYFKIAKEVGWIDEIYSDLYPSILKKNYDITLFFSRNKGFNPFPSQRKWIIDYYFEILNLEKNFSLVLPIKEDPNSPLKNKIVIHPGSGSFKKIPNFSLFKKIENYLVSQGFETIYLVGEGDDWVKNLVKNYWECFDPLIIAKFLKSAKLYIGLDSGISHLATYLGVKSYLFYGPTDYLIWKPIGIDFKIISLELECSPCFPKVCENKNCLDPHQLFEKFIKVFSYL